MIEDVCHKGWGVFFELCARLLNDNGSIQLQAINIPHQRYDKYRKNCDFIQKYIFPGGLLPSLTRMSNIASKHSLVITESTSIGYDYFLTLEEWKQNLTSNWQVMLDQGFKTEFMRRFDYYFSYCAGAFKSNHIDNHQISFRKRQSIVVWIFYWSRSFAGLGLAEDSQVQAAALFQNGVRNENFGFG